MVQLRSDATQEMHIHLMQMPNLEARMNRLCKFIVNSRYFNFRKSLVLQRECLFRVVKDKGLEGRGFVAEEGLEERGIEGGVDFAVEHGQRCDLDVRVLIAAIDVLEIKVEEGRDGLDYSAVICLVTNYPDDVSYPGNRRFHDWRFTWVNAGS